MNAELDFVWDVPPVEGAEEALCRVAQECARAEGLTLPAYAQVRVTGDEEIREINLEYRQVDRATDVLSFPSTDCAPDRTLGQNERLLRRERDETGRCFLGDIVISLPRAREQAQEYGHSLKRELAYLTAHAMFHLMGYDHMRDEDKERMRAMEEKALNQAGMARVTDDELIALAKEAMEYSYSPYSHFRVGAALLARNGRVFQGCNIENAAFTPGICAERTAFYKAVSEGAGKFAAICIVGGREEMPSGYSAPCGVCRQVMREFCDPETFLVILATDPEHYEVHTLGELLPMGFGPENLA